MADECTIRLSRDEAIVLLACLQRWDETGQLQFADEAERVVLDNLECLLESADDGTLFAPDDTERVAAALRRLRPDS